MYCIIFNYKLNNPPTIISVLPGLSVCFCLITGTPTPDELEDVTRLWQTSLYNAHIDCQRLFSCSSFVVKHKRKFISLFRFVVDTNRVIFMFKDGAKAWEAKSFFIEQDRCLEVTIEGKSYPGKKSGVKSEL